MQKEVECLEIPVKGKREGLMLIIYPQSSKAKVYEESTPSAGESEYQLDEGCTYTYEFFSTNDGHIYQFSKEDDIIKYHRSQLHKKEGTITTGIYVGQLSLQVVDKDAQEIVGKIRLEIQSTKSEYRTDYRIMLDEIAEYYTDLVLQQGSPVTQHLEIDSSCSSKTLYQRFSFVRSLIESESFSEAIHKILSNPVRKWTDANIERNIVGVKRLSRNNIRQIASSTDRIHLSERMRAGMPASLSSVPRKIEVEYKRDTTDVLENQFVKFVLRTFVNFCSEIKSFKNASERLKLEADQTIEQLYGYLENQFFHQISQPSHLNLNSPVLQRKEGYREILQAWLLFDLAAKLNWDGGDDVYEAGKKNVATLYEYWLFFKMMELISEFFNIEPKDKTELVEYDKDRINLNLKQGRMRMVSGRQETFSRLINVAFYYNRTFNKVEADNDPIHKAGSWTMTMRPDYTLSLWPGEITEAEAEKQELITHIHFDAKYRLSKVLLEDKDIDLDINNELDEEKQNQELKIYKRGDLLKMHAYKDAIRRTSGAYVLYPGTDKRDVLRGFHEIVPGLGAFSIRPGHWQEDSIYLKQFLAEVKAHLMDRSSEREKMSFHQYDIHLAPQHDMLMQSLPESEGENRDFMPDETYVILGYYKSEEHLKWINSNWLYNSREGIRGGSVSITKEVVSAKYLLLHNHKNEAHLYKLTVEGPKIYGFDDMTKLSYPYDQPITDQIREYIYLIFKINKKGVEKEFQKYKWKPLDIPQIRSSSGFKISTIKLSELIKLAKII
ncbi:MAG: DUF2357 domain-containing protein [Prevotella sp.]|nr:DUF2357 domain-containing protein [Prevotella sp.]